MARRPSKHLRPPRPLLVTSRRAESKADGPWVVQAVPARSEGKAYWCPGCNQRIEPGASHTVAWPHPPAIGSSSAVEDRRHWHTACWNRRL